MPLTALKTSGWVPTVPAAGVPDKIPVTGSNVTPVGKVPTTERVGAGEPAVVTVKVPGNPRLKETWSALVMDGPAVTVRVKLCTASGKVPLAAVNVSG